MKKVCRHHFYLNQDDLEILNTNLPYKSSQCYNFAVLGITLTGFPYAYED